MPSFAARSPIMLPTSTAALTLPPFFICSLKSGAIVEADTSVRPVLSSMIWA